MQFSLIREIVGHEKFVYSWVLSVDFVFKVYSRFHISNFGTLIISKILFILKPLSIISSIRYSWWCKFCPTLVGLSDAFLRIWISIKHQICAEFNSDPIRIWIQNPEFSILNSEFWIALLTADCGPLNDLIIITGFKISNIHTHT